MSNKIVICLTAMVPDKSGAEQMAVGRFEMIGDWVPMELGKPEINYTHPTKIISIDVNGPNGAMVTPYLNKDGVLDLRIRKEST